jgi:hypothetical protein
MLEGGGPWYAGASLLSRVLTDPMLTGISFVDAHGALRAGQMAGLFTHSPGVQIGYLPSSC